MKELVLAYTHNSQIFQIIIPTTPILYMNMIFYFKLLNLATTPNLKHHEMDWALLILLGALPSSP